MNSTVILIAIMAGVTIAIRFLPFILFSKGTPLSIKYLGNVLPYSVMAMLVVYCLRNTEITAAPYGMREVIAVATVIGLHKWKHNSILSIVGGTAVYMILNHIIKI